MKLIPSSNNNATRRQSSSATNNTRSSGPSVQPQETAPVYELSDAIKSLLSEDKELKDLDKTKIIDLKTGKEVKMSDFDLDDPEEAAEYQEVMERSVTLYTDGRDEGLTSINDASFLAEALAEYIANPYTHSISEDGLEDSLDNLSFKLRADILAQAQNIIYSSNDPSDKIKLNNFQNDNNLSRKGLDKIIHELYNHNYEGGNTGSPNVFLNDIFKNDPAFKLNSININQISDQLASQLEKYLDEKKEDRDPKYLNFIQQTISQLAATDPDNEAQGHIARLLQETLGKVTGNDDNVVKEILSNLSHQAGVETYKAVSVSTGQQLIGQFGEYTYFDDNGRGKSFSSDENLPNDLKTDIIGLITGDHPSLSEYTDDAAGRAVIASQAADLLVALSPEHQTEIINALYESDNSINILQNFSNTAGDDATNLNDILNKLESIKVSETIQNAETAQAKATIFVEGIKTLENPSDPIQIQQLIDKLVDGEEFLNLSAEDAVIFFTELELELTENNISNPTAIIENITEALSSHNVQFRSTATDEEFFTSQLTDIDNLFLDQLLDKEKNFSTDQAESFLNSLSDEEKLDPELFAEFLEDGRNFNTESEYDNFKASLGNILKELETKDSDEWDILKENLTDLLLTSEPELLFESNDATDILDEDMSYLAHLLSDDGDIISNGALDIIEIVQNEEFLEYLAEKEPANADSFPITDQIKDALQSSNETEYLAAFVVFNNNLEKYQNIHDDSTSSATSAEQADANFILLLNNIEPTTDDTDPKVKARLLSEIEVMARYGDVNLVLQNIRRLEGAGVLPDRAVDNNNQLSQELKNFIQNITKSILESTNDKQTATDAIYDLLLELVTPYDQKDYNDRLLIKDIAFEFGKAINASGNKNLVNNKVIFDKIESEEEFAIRARFGKESASHRNSPRIGKNINNWRQFVGRIFNNGYNGEDKGKGKVGDIN